VHESRITIVSLLCALTAGGCVAASSNAVPPPRIAVLGGRPATQYGRDASEVFDHPALRARIRALFGTDWSSTRASGLTAPVPEYFARSSAPTELRIENADWVALRGCAPQACTRRRGLVLISPRGDRLLARIDDGGYTREYGSGPGMVTLQANDRAVIDAAWHALGGQAAWVGASAAQDRGADRDR
jgi:hypothetical protein